MDNYFTALPTIKLSESENEMENEIKKLISEWKWELAHGTTDQIRKNTIHAFLNDLESLLKFKQENCCGKAGE